MYTVEIEYEDYKKRVRKTSVSFNLDSREVFKMLPELKTTFEWLESNKAEEPRDLSVEEVSNFYTNFENILLEAWGEMSEDGLSFRKGGKYEFEETALFNACMWRFVTKPQDTVKLLEGILPAEMFQMVQNADESQIAAARAAAKDSDKVKDEEIARLRAQLQGEQGQQ